VGDSIGIKKKKKKKIGAWLKKIGKEQLAQGLKNWEGRDKKPISLRGCGTFGAKGGEGKKKE